MDSQANGPPPVVERRRNPWVERAQPTFSEAATHSEAPIYADRAALNPNMRGVLDYANPLRKPWVVSAQCLVGFPELFVIRL